MTTRQFVGMVFDAVGKPPKLQAAPRPLVLVLSLFNAALREQIEMLYEFEEPFVLDHGKYAGAFGGEPTPHEEAIRETLGWYEAQAAG